MLIIDCDTYFGKHSGSAADCSIETLLQLERAQGVSYVMAYSLKARTYDAREGNDEALEVSRRRPEVLPVATVDPRAYRNVEDEIERVAKLGFAAVRVFPEMQGWSLDSLLFQRIVDACGERTMPLMVTADGGSKASKVVERAHNTTNPIIFLNANYNMQAEAFEAAASRPNTLVSTQFFTTPGVFEEAAEKLGADRLVIGTTCPDFSIRQTISMLMRSELSEEQKALVLGGNLTRILGRSLEAKHSRDAYESRCVKGPIIDVHGHTGPWPFPMKVWSIRQFEARLRSLGIEKCVVSSTKAIVNDFVAGNAELARDIEGSDTMFGYVTVNPNYVEQSIEELQRYLDMPQFVGVKFHTGYTRSTTDTDAFRAIIKVAAPRRMPLLTHTWGPGEPAKAQRLAEAFPDMPIIMAHGGVTAWQEAVDAIKNTPNVYTEFCSSQCQRGKIRETINQVGPERVLFGTDASLFDPAYVLGEYEEADLSAEEARAIMYSNAKRLFGFK